MNEEIRADSRYAAAIVFVQLGKNPSPILLNSASCASTALANSQIILLCDYPAFFADFPGTVIKVDRELHLGEVKKYFRKHWEFSRISGGYWRYSLERIFVLSQIEQYVSNSTPIIHIESDVLSLINCEILELMIKNLKKVAVVRYSKDAGIASTLFAPNIYVLNESLQKLAKMLTTKKKYIVDMELLGTALNLGLLEELPTYPDKAWALQAVPMESPSYVVFDGAHIGQYLFGRDPLHNNGFLETGYKNPSYNWTKFEEGFAINSWGSNHGREILQFNYDQKICICACVHVHSKRLLPSPKSSPKFWEPFIKAGNGDQVIFPEVFVKDLIHSARDPISARIKRLVSRKFWNSRR